MENNLDDAVNIGESVVTENMKMYLQENRKWALFLGLLSFIGAGFLVIGGLAVMTVGSSFGNAAEMPFPMSLLGLVYILLAMIYIYPALQLTRYSSRAKEALNTDNQLSYEACEKHIRNLFRFFGWLMVITIGLYVVTIIVALMFGALS